ncbi:MAG: hypothetical protein VX642_09730 [Bdellovibrionota bacterium]|nr:hypothetical protein [Bdellovibrionota bacterium]
MKIFIALGLVGLTMVSCNLNSNDCNSSSSYPLEISSPMILPSFYYYGNQTGKIETFKDKEEFIKNLYTKVYTPNVYDDIIYPQESCSDYVLAASNISNPERTTIEKTKHVYSPEITFNTQSEKEWSFYFKKEFIKVRQINYVYPFLESSFDSVKSISDEKNRNIEMQSQYFQEFIAFDGELSIYEFIHCKIQSRKKSRCIASYWQSNQEYPPSILVEENRLIFKFAPTNDFYQTLSYDINKQGFKIHLSQQIAKSF